MKEINSEAKVDDLAKIIWNYHLMHQKLEKADGIFVLGSHDPNVAEYAIELYFQGWAPYLIFSGGVQHPKGALKNTVPQTEAEAFFSLALSKKVPENALLIENKATNTGENFQFTDELLRTLQKNFQKFILVQKPYMERRTYATAKVKWPNKQFIVTSQPISYDDYIKQPEINKYKFINTMVGDLQRIKIYPHKGFQIHQDIPDKVWDAFEELVSLGYNKRLINEEK